jgi:hypothetical protein
MVAPKVFLSSTIYDVRHVRNELKKFFDNYGFIPILSEEYDILYTPSQSNQTSCLDEISDCDIFIIIIGSRYGTIEKGELYSITHKEFQEARTNNLIIYVFYDFYVYQEYKSYINNEERYAIGEYKFIHILDKKVIDLIKEVESHNPSLPQICYINTDEIVKFLRKQLSLLIKQKVFMKKTVETKEETINIKKENKKTKLKTNRIKNNVITYSIYPSWDNFINYLIFIGLPRFDYSDIRLSNNVFELFDRKSVKFTREKELIRLDNNESQLIIGNNVIDMINKRFITIKKEVL